MFDKQIILVSGASSGIGRATALQFASKGGIVIATSRKESGGRHIERELQDINSDCTWIQADIMDNDQVAQLFDNVRENYSRLDIAFNNASSGSSWMKQVHELHVDNFNDTVHGTLTSVFVFMHHELEMMTNHKSGVIINNSSVDGLRGFPMDVAYSAAKHGVIGLTKSAALQYAKSGIRINAIAPGWIRTPPIKNMITSDPQAEELMLQHQPIGRLGEPDEVADVVIWLASDQATMMTGGVISVDGGYTAV